MGLFSRQTSKVTRIAVPSGAVKRSNLTLMQQRGWTATRTCNGWAGPYATKYGTWPGTIEKAGDTFRVFIRNPPSVLQRHARWHCFHSHGDDGWYSIHLAISPVDNDPNAIVRYVEQIITESFKL